MVDILQKQIKTTYTLEAISTETKCDDPWEKGMFQDVDVKIQVRSYLNFDVNVLKHAFFPWIITMYRKY